MIREDITVMIIHEVALLLQRRVLGIRKEERINLGVVIMKNIITEMIGMPPPEDARIDSLTRITLHTDGHELITTMMMIQELHTHHNDGQDLITTMMMIHALHTHHNDGHELITTMMMIHALHTHHNDGQDLIYTMMMIHALHTHHNDGQDLIYTMIM
jgi:hypothetical protein